MAKRRMTKDDIVKLFNSSKRPSKKALMDALIELGVYESKEKIKNEYDKLETNRYFNEMGIEIQCPVCHSKHMIKKGYNTNGLRIYKCKDCNKKFTIISQTIFDNSKYSLHVWIDLIYEMTLHHTSEKIFEHLSQKYKDVYHFSQRNIIDMRLKVMYAVEQIIEQEFLEKPFTNTIYMDETFFKENQSGTLEENLYNAYPDEKTRHSRHGSEPMEYGIMTDDYANVLCVIDWTGRAYARLINMGKTTDSEFNKYIVPKLDIPKLELVCTDNQISFKQFCKEHHIMQSITPSGYYNEIAKIKDLDEKEQFYQMKMLYEKGKLGRIYFEDHLYEFSDYLALVNTYELRLDRANKLHSELKTIINRKYNGVPTKNLQSYVSWVIFLHNWRLQKNKSITIESAKEILAFILTSHYQIKLKQINERDISKITRPCKNDFLEVKSINKTGRKSKHYYKAHPNDNVDRKAKDILDSLSRAEIIDIYKFAKIVGYVNKSVYQLREQLSKCLDFKEIYIAYQAANSIRYEDDYEAYISNMDTLYSEKAMMKSLLKYAKITNTGFYGDNRPNKTLFIDVETTGTNVNEDEVLEIAVINQFGFKVYHSYVMPENKFSWEPAEKVTHLSPDFLFEHGKYQEQVKKELRDVFDETDTIIAYNVDFDL